MRIYIAGPLGFSEAGRTFYYDKLIPAVRQLGHEALDPWTLTDPGKIATVMNLPYGPTKRPWRRCPARGYAGRCTSPGTAVRIA
jgi:hypothetical protein